MDQISAGRRGQGRVAAQVVALRSQRRERGGGTKRRAIARVARHDGVLDDRGSRRARAQAQRLHRAKRNPGAIECVVADGAIEQRERVVLAVGKIPDHLSARVIAERAIGRGDGGAVQHQRRALNRGRERVVFAVAAEGRGIERSGTLIDIHPGPVDEVTGSGHQGVVGNRRAVNRRCAAEDANART